MSGERRRNRPGFLNRLGVGVFGNWLRRRGWKTHDVSSYGGLSYWWYGPYGKQHVLWAYEPSREWVETTRDMNVWSCRSTTSAVLIEWSKGQWV